MNDAMNGSQSGETLPRENDSLSTSSDNVPLHESIMAHLQTCSQCRKTSRALPNGLGMKSQFCSEYLDIFRQWAKEEGEVNNIVAHDEYGNQASTISHERYPHQWR